MDPQLTDPILRLAKIPTGKRPVRQDVEGSVAKVGVPTRGCGGRGTRLVSH